MGKSAAEITRVERPRLAARETYDRLAIWYDLLAWPERSIKREAVALLSAQLGERILVIGCGTGKNLTDIADSVSKAGYALGIDIAEKMCRRTQDRLQAQNLDDQAHVVCADAYYMPLIHEAFDAALMVFTLELFDTGEMPVVLDQTHKALRPGGRLCVACLSRRHVNLAVHSYEMIHNRWTRHLDCRPIMVHPLLVDAGFRIVKSVPRSLAGLPVDIVLATKP